LCSLLTSRRMYLRSGIIFWSWTYFFLSNIKKSIYVSVRKSNKKEYFSLKYIFFNSSDTHIKWHQELFWETKKINSYKSFVLHDQMKQQMTVFTASEEIGIKFFLCKVMNEWSFQLQLKPFNDMLKGKNWWRWHCLIRLNESVNFLITTVCS
jgi:hypothetical protein